MINWWFMHYAVFHKLKSMQLKHEYLINLILYVGKKQQHNGSELTQWKMSVTYERVFTCVSWYRKVHFLIGWNFFSCDRRRYLNKMVWNRRKTLLRKHRYQYTRYCRVPLRSKQTHKVVTRDACLILKGAWVEANVSRVTASAISHRATERGRKGKFTSSQLVAFDVSMCAWLPFLLHCNNLIKQEGLRNQEDC